MEYKKFMALCLVALTLAEAATLPQHPVYKPEEHSPQVREERKFDMKPNASKKVGIDDIDDIGSNSIQESGGTGFSWSSMLGMIMQMLLGQTGALTGPSKNDIDEGVAASPWSNLLNVGLRVITAILGGAQQSDSGFDKVDNPQSGTMQGILTAVLSALIGQGRNPEGVATMAKNASEFINIVMNLLDALKTSFSHRSLNARSLGKRDSVSEAAVASISMLKAYMRTMKAYSTPGRAEDDEQRGCAERIICEASADCAADSPKQSQVFCQIGSYAVSWFFQGRAPFDALYDAARRGRSGENCRTIFMDCNAI